jgi:hypothetical protein
LDSGVFTGILANADDPATFARGFELGVTGTRGLPVAGDHAIGTRAGRTAAPDVSIVFAGVLAAAGRLAAARYRWIRVEEAQPEEGDQSQEGTQNRFGRQHASRGHVRDSRGLVEILKSGGVAKKRRPLSSVENPLTTDGLRQMVEKDACGEDRSSCRGNFKLTPE